MSEVDVVPLAAARSRLRHAGTAVAPAPAPDSAARWVARLARTLHPAAGDATCAPAAREAVYRHPVWAEPNLDLDGLPVLLVGGLASTPHSMEIMRAWLVRANAHPRVSPVGYGVDCGERTTQQVSREARRLADITGRRSVLVAHSRGGQFARAVAVRDGDVVRGLITLGTPINRLVGVRPALRAELAVLGALGTLGVPGLVGVGCLWGACCRRLREDIQAPVPAGLPYLSLYSRRDEFVSWRSCLDPSARHRAVTASHSGMLCSAEVLQVLAEELAATDGAGGLAGVVEPATAA